MLLVLLYLLRKIKIHTFKICIYILAIAFLLLSFQKVQGFLWYLPPTPHKEIPLINHVMQIDWVKINSLRIFVSLKKAFIFFFIFERLRLASWESEHHQAPCELHEPFSPQLLRRCLPRLLNFCPMGADLSIQLRLSGTLKLFFCAGLCSQSFSLCLPVT